MPAQISTTEKLQRRTAVVVTTATIQTVQDVQVSLVEVTTTLTVVAGNQAAVCLVTATTQVLPAVAAEHLAVAQTAAATVRLRVPLLLQVKAVEAHQAAVVINS